MTMRKASYHNDQFRINRRDLLRALGFNPEFSDHKIPVGKTGRWKNVKVPSGWQGEEFVILPLVILRPRGVAKRLQAECPQCGTMMRFCVLRQHVGSKTCLKKAAKAAAKRTEPALEGIVRPVFLAPDVPMMTEVDFRGIEVGCWRRST
jgi:hypothetical protein